MRLAILIVSTFVLLALGAFLASVDRLESALLKPAPGSAVERVVVVPEGMSASALLSQLEAASLVSNDGWLSLYGERLRASTRFLPGEYALSSEMNPLLQLSKIERGDVMIHTVNIAPGSTDVELARALANVGLGAADEFIAIIRDPESPRRFGVDAPSLEGFLLPDVYTMPKGLAPQVVLKTLADRFSAFVADHANPKRPLFDVVRVASLVELAPVPARERRVYAAYVYNRLARRLPIEHPRSAAYGTARGFADADNPYRTDRPGLPPTPICYAGPDALKAALHPATSDALYMVRREDGSHIYCPDRECYFAAQRARQGLPPMAPRGTPRPQVVVEPPPPPPPLVVPGQPLDPQPPSEDPEQPL